jgi:hypothetical protein
VWIAEIDLHVGGDGETLVVGHLLAGFAEIAAEFVKIRADVIVTAGSAVPAIKQTTSIIPIVFAIATDPVGGGLVESLARPGSNGHRRVRSGG